MSSSIITVCTRIHAVLSNKTYTRHTRARARARTQVTSLMDLLETHREGSEDNGRYRTEEVNVSSEQAIMTGETQRNKIK